MMRLIGERRNFFKCIAVVIFSFASLPAKSDPIRGYRAVHVTYDGSAKVLKVAVERVELRWNDYAEMERLEDSNRFILWNRISYDEDQFVKSIVPAVRVFDTSAGELQVNVIPVPGNINGNGRCGAHMGAAVSVSLDGAMLVERRKVISSDCNSREVIPFLFPLSR